MWLAKFRVVALAAVSGIALLAGCGGTAFPLQPRNGEQHKSAQQVAVDAGQALKSASSVHVLVTGKQQNDTFGFDLRLSHRDAVGTLTLNGVSCSW